MIGWAARARPPRLSPRQSASILVGVLLLLVAAGVSANGDGQLFYYGHIIDVNRGSRVITVRGDDKVKRRFLVTSEALIQRHIEAPIATTFDHLKVGLRVRILAGTPTMNPTIRAAVSLLVYD